MAQKYSQKLKNNTINKKLNNQITKIKNQVLIHCKRLNKRKNEELDKGAHEYANYIVSMINTD